MYSQLGRATCHVPSLSSRMGFAWPAGCGPEPAGQTAATGAGVAAVRGGNRGVHTGRARLSVARHRRHSLHDIGAERSVGVFGVDPLAVVTLGDGRMAAVTDVRGHRVRLRLRLGW